MNHRIAPIVLFLAALVLGGFSQNFLMRDSHVLSEVIRIGSGVILTTNSDNTITISASVHSTNALSFSITTNDFALNTYYTNSVQRGFVQATVSLTNVVSTDFAKVFLYLDQDANGTWERTAMGASLGGVALLSSTVVLSAHLQPGARFLFTNQTAGIASASIVANSSQWVRQ